MQVLLLMEDNLTLSLYCCDLESH